MEKDNRHIIVSFNSGTLVIDDWNILNSNLLSDKILFDERIKSYRAKAYHYAEIISFMRKNKIKHKDYARNFSPININLNKSLSARDYQQKALRSWQKSNYRGIISMPTGSGKSFLAMMAVNYLKRPAMIIVPTIDLMFQWGRHIDEHFGVKPGYLGGGFKEIRNITVSTYDSAVIHMEYAGNKFAFLIFDECHHLPSPTNKLCAEMSIAPYRMGLSATPESSSGTEIDPVSHDILGPLVFNLKINELKGKVLSKYITKKIYIDLTSEEKEEYNICRKKYTDFLKLNRIDFSKPKFWQQFIGLCARKANGREIYRAYLRQKNIARSSIGKIKFIWKLLKHHKTERIIIFTADNDTAYKLGDIFFLPVLTHKTKPQERKDFLDKFKTGEYHILVTSKVLNEGIDVPEANIGIIVSGSASIREHVQRLGRILRPYKNKNAILYELISKATGEENVSSRRRKHVAYI